MTGEELRRRIERLGLTYTDATVVLGLSYPGLQHQMRGERRVSRQTELLLDRLDELVALGQPLGPTHRWVVRQAPAESVRPEPPPVKLERPKLQRPQR